MQVDCASVVFAEVETASLKGRIFWLCYIEIKQHVDTNLITCFTEFRKKQGCCCRLSLKWEFSHKAHRVKPAVCKD